MGKDVYVRRLYKATCSEGTMENYLNVFTDHGTCWVDVNVEPGATYDDKQPLMNALDFHHQEKENITHFGRCNSSTNFGNVVDKEEIIMNLLCPLSVIIKNMSGCSGCRCKPIISEVWGEPNDKVLVEGVPILSEESKCYCRNGGIITIVPVDIDSPEEQN